MSELKNDSNAPLDVELARLRDALRDVHAADGGEESLRAAFRAHHPASAEPALATSARPQPDREKASRSSRGLSRRHVDFVAGALAATIAIAAVVLIGLWRTDRDGPESAAAAAGEGSVRSGVDAIPAAAAFQPLSYSREISPTQAYTIVRVRVPLTALGIGYDAPPNATIEADLLLGEDGIPTGIRFDTTNAQLVSMASH
jgi:hypothetical protein